MPLSSPVILVALPRVPLVCASLRNLTIRNESYATTLTPRLWHRGVRCIRKQNQLQFSNPRSNHVSDSSFMCIRPTKRPKRIRQVYTKGQLTLQDDGTTMVTPFYD